MKKFVKVISLIMALLMVAAVFAACGKKNEDDKKEPVGSDVATTQQGGDDATTEVPDIEVINWEGREYRILGYDSTTYAWAQHFEVWRQEMPDDVMGKAVWERNITLRDNYGIEVVGCLENGATALAATTLEAGEDLYDLLLIAPEAFHPHASKGYMIDLYNLEYINMSHDAWMPYPNKQLTMGGKLYYTTNKFLVQDKNRCWGSFYNRDMAKELNLGYFEDYVFDGTWTIDKVTELAKLATYEKDGENGLGKFDNWGAAASENYMFCQLAYGVGFRLTDHGADGYPVLVGPTDDMVARLDKVFALTANSDIYYCDTDYNTTVDWGDCADQMFHRGEVLISLTVLSELQTVGSKIEFEMGVLPNPKFDEKQEAYYSIPNLGNGSLLGVPVTVPDSEFAGYALEVISEQSVDSTYTAFIETTCKLQKVQDDDAARCLELIYDGIAYDVAFVSNIGGLGSMIWNLGSLKSNSYTRLYDRASGNAILTIDRIKADYQKLDNKH